MSNVVINRNPSYIPDPIRNPALINDNDSTEYAHLHAKPTMIEEVIETETQEIQQ